MINQEVKPISAPAAPSVMLPKGLPDTASVSVPCRSLVQRADQYGAHLRARIHVLASEHVASHLVTLPKAAARHRAAMLAFALEDQVAAPIETVVVTPGPVAQKGRSGDGTLVFVANNKMIENLPDDLRVMPEFLLVPRPKGDDTWCVWREGPRAVVRQSDGTGFACLTTALPLVWDMAGQPALISLAHPLPDPLVFEDRSANPPPPDPADMAFQFLRDTAQSGAGIKRFAPWLMGLALAAGTAHLALVAADVWALKRQAADARATAEAAIAPFLPGVTLAGPVDPILARLTPAPQTVSRSDFLPVLAQVSEALTQVGNTGAPLGFRRLSWGTDNQLVILIEAANLNDLQRAQQTLQAQGFQVSAGAANASDGGAEVEMRLKAPAL